MTRILLATLLLSLVASSALADGTEAPDRLGGPRGAFVALSVADVATMSAWYQEKLGLRVLASGEAPNKVAKFALLEGSGFVLELIQHSKAQTRSSAAPSITDSYQIHGIFKAGLIVDDLDGLYAGLKQKTVPVAYDLMPAKDVPMRSFAVRDAEGNLLQFFGK